MTDQTDTIVYQRQEGDKQNAPYIRVFSAEKGSREYRLLKDMQYHIGRSPDCDIVLDDRSVSRKHARIFWQDGSFMISDSGSRSGIMVNDAQVISSSLKHSDIVRISDFILQYREDAMSPHTESSVFVPEGSYCLLPSVLKARSRTVKIAPEEVFFTGDTTYFGTSGILMPAAELPEEKSIEVEIFSQNGETLRIISAERIGQEQRGDVWLIYLKLHIISGQKTQALWDNAERGEWVQI